MTDFEEIVFETYDQALDYYASLQGEEKRQFEAVLEIITDLQQFDGIVEDVRGSAVTF